MGPPMLMIDLADGMAARAGTARRGLPRWFRPAIFIAVPVATSLGAWVLLVISRDFQPASASLEALTGFATPAQVTPRGAALLAVWYISVIATATIGWRLATGKKPVARIDQVTENLTFQRRYFLLVLAAATVGIGYSYYKITQSASILDSLASQTGNSFTNSLSGSTGIETLRYATILAAPIAIHLWRQKIVSWPLMIFAVLLLASNSMIASRLSLLMAAAVYLAIWARNNHGRGSRWSTGQRLAAVLVIVALGFAALATLNYFRNANYYRDAGVTNPAAMNLYQMGSYLAVPAQVSIGVSGAVMSGAWQNTGDPVSSFDAVQPTFLQFGKIRKDDSWKGADYYGHSVGFAPHLFTNSVFADTYADYGAWGWPYTILLYGFAGYLMARAMAYSGVIAGSGGVLAYCFAELWRIQIVSYGIVIFLLLTTVFGAWIASWGLRDKPQESVSTS